ncbi:MAG: right-handed parallel beta-helix repeat-containing protein [Euryarchaeota archaeon]|nr:right-handed parallel beta-helix repeat-containing protein [Euryarchaeota archaeon]
MGKTLGKCIPVAVRLMMVLCAMVVGSQDGKNERDANIQSPFSNYTSHAPFRINSNAEFASMATSEGWAGDGAYGNPYIIENYNINGTGVGYCIFIGNVTSFFTVHGCYLHHASGNSATYARNSGMYLYLTKNGTLNDNNVSLCSNVGIYLLNSNNDTVYNNAIWSNAFGIALESSSGNNIMNCTAALNQQGIYLYYNAAPWSDNNTIQNNTLFFNSDGLRFYKNCKNNLVRGNDVYNNSYGINLVNSPVSNTLYHNNFRNNTIQASDTGTNTWDNGYPSGGNYWDNYNGTDVMSGPNQDLSGSDGIGDTPYLVSGGFNKDRYPIGIFQNVLIFQVQSPYPGFRIINCDSFESSIQIANSSLLNSTGDFKIDSINSGWLSNIFLSPQNLLGTWKFRVFGKLNTYNAHGYLYSIVKKNVSGEKLFTTNYDDEDIVNFTSFHCFYWDYSVINKTLLPANDRLLIELWIHVSSVLLNCNITHTYDYSNVTQTSGPHDAWKCQGGFDSNLVEFSNVEYSEISCIDSISIDNSQFFRFKVKIDEVPTTVNFISLLCNGTYGICNVDPWGALEIHAWNTVTGIWDLINNWYTGWGQSGIFVANITYNCSNYISGGYLLWGMLNWNAGSTDYIAINITQIYGNAPTFSFAFDNNATPSTVEYSLSNTSFTNYKIPVVAGWSFISSPLINGYLVLPNALLDCDGDTTWDRLQWYDPFDATNYWKQYNTGWASTLNDLTTVNRTMGVWINITTVGDGFLNLTGLNSTFTSIPLHTGWNMVGYPSLNTTTTVAVAFWGTGATMVEAFDANATYHTKVVGPNYIMKPGEGYWVYVPADTVWVVDW